MKSSFSPPAPSATSPTALTLRADLAPQTRDPAHWLWNTDAASGPQHASHTDGLAQRVVDDYTAGGTVKGLKPGYAGLASYRVDMDVGPSRHLKIAIPPQGDAAQDPRKLADYTKLCDHAALEAQRAAWAGHMGVGPEVFHIDAKRGAFVSAFVAGAVPSFEAAQTTLRPGYLAALAKLHTSPLDRLPPDGPRNWFFEHRAQSLMDAADKPQPQALQHAVMQLEAGLESYFAKAFHPSVAIHDDLHPLNSLAHNNEVVLIDWNNLRRGDAAIDIGHVATMLDWAMPELPAVVREYTHKASLLGSAAASADSSLASRAQSYTAYFRLRGFTFYDQWAGTKPISNYLRQRMAEDIEGLEKGVLRALDLRPDASLRKR